MKRLEEPSDEVEDNNTIDMDIESGSRSELLLKWRRRTFVWLFIGYVGYYFCRADFTVATPLILSTTTLTRGDVGSILSAGTFFYATAKVFTGFLTDYLGSQKVFVIGQVGSAIATMLMAASSSYTSLLVLWVVNRVFQSMGWSAIVRMAHHWYPAGRHGKIMGILTCSYTFGDALVRLILGVLVMQFPSFTYRTLFLVSAIILAIISIPSILYIKPAPQLIHTQCWKVTPPESAGESKKKERDSCTQLYKASLPLLKEKKFWIVIVLSTTLHYLRETFRDWLPVVLMDTVFHHMGKSVGIASVVSFVFPLAGGVAGIVSGHYIDKWRGKGKVCTVCHVALFLSSIVAVLLIGGERPPEGMSFGVLILILTVLIFVLGCSVSGPYSMISGVFALELMDKGVGIGTIQGIIDSVGYFGAVISGMLTGGLSETFGWGTVFVMFPCISFISLLFSVWWWYLEARANPPEAGAVPLPEDE